MHNKRYKEKSLQSVLGSTTSIRLVTGFARAPEIKLHLLPSQQLKNSRHHGEMKCSNTHQWETQ